MQSGSAGRYINSVSDIIGTDEIEFLLDDIKDLEPTNVNPEDIQDFEIAGSRTGALSVGGGGDATDCAGGCECETPMGTINSWDSHSHYRRHTGASPDLSLYSGVIVYCDHSHLRTATGLFRILLVMCTVACLACLCTSGTVKVGLFMLPLVGRIRLMMFVTLLSLFITCLLLFLDISHMVYLFPFNWGKVNAYFYVGLSILFLVASSLIFHMIFLSEAFSWVPRWTKHQLLITGSLGYVCCLESVILTVIQKCTMGKYQPVIEDPSMNLQERQSSPEHTANQTTVHNYKPLTNYPAIPSTSRQQPHNYLDEIEPCSSTNVDRYHIA